MARRLSLLVVLALAGIVLVTPGVASAGGCIPEADLELTSSADRSIEIDECSFVATVTYVEPGDRVRWTNTDHVPHTVTGAALSWGNQNSLDVGDSVSYRFEDEGVFPYYCAFHPTMVGAVVVGDGGGPGVAASSAVAPADDAAPASSTESPPVDDGLSPVVVVLAIAAALAGVVGLTRYALSRRASAPSAS